MIRIKPQVLCFALIYKKNVVLYKKQSIALRHFFCLYLPCLVPRSSP